MQLDDALAAVFKTQLQAKKEKNKKIGELFGTSQVTGKLPTYPSPKPTFYFKSEVSVNVNLGEGQVGSFPEAQDDWYRFCVLLGVNNCLFVLATHCVLA